MDWEFSGINAIKFYDIIDQKNWLCSFGLHLFTKRLKGEGYFTLDYVCRLRCLCGKWEWVKYNNSVVRKEKG